MAALILGVVPECFIKMGCKRLTKHQELHEDRLVAKRKYWQRDVSLTNYATGPTPLKNYLLLGLRRDKCRSRKKT
jgi:hypothetical protein